MRIKKVVRCVAKVDVVENWAQAGQASCGTSSLERLVPAEGLPVVSAVAIAGRCSHQTRAKRFITRAMQSQSSHLQYQSPGVAAQINMGVCDSCARKTFIEYISGFTYKRKTRGSKTRRWGKYL
jgi:hypothetical protein